MQQALPQRPAVVRPVAVAAFPLEVDHPDDARDDEVLLDLGAGFAALNGAVTAHGGTLLQLDVEAGGSAAICVFGTRDRWCVRVPV